MITHSHPLGIEGARIQAAAVAYAAGTGNSASLDVAGLLRFVRGFASEELFLRKLTAIDALLQSADDRRRIVRELGHGIEAFNSVPTALFCFLCQPHDFRTAVLYAVSLGGDTDTIASMAGAISGAHLGAEALPTDWLARLEDRDYIEDLAERLADVAPA
jgi:poly(ADP-ribose) glycohydrolase ARH3